MRRVYLLGKSREILPDFKLRPTYTAAIEGVNYVTYHYIVVMSILYVTDARGSISRVASPALARKAAHNVGTVCIGVTVVQPAFALIHI